MKLNLDQPVEDAQIQIIPLIDVIFCILTFFILASLQITRQQAINVDLPQAATGQVQMREMLVVTIDNVGQTYIDKQPIDPASLYDRLKQYHDSKPDGLLVLNASQSAYYNDVIRVLDILRKVGGDKVALATIPEGTNPSTTGSPIPGMPGTTFPGAPMPGSNFPGGGIPGSNMPGSMPSSNMPGSNMPGSMPGSNPPGSMPNPNMPNNGVPNPAIPGSNPSDPLNPSNSSTNPTGPNPIAPNQPAQPNPAQPADAN
ncbi:MAG: biopolymer transporter ExbD [Alkalinema sp. RU_4_3]|nr:biopolymer transporter ExbD [Alkalinema sp. RU_4_3]